MTIYSLLNFLSEVKKRSKITSERGHAKVVGEVTLSRSWIPSTTVVAGKLPHS
jgi:hypothetical protein